MKIKETGKKNTGNENIDKKKNKKIVDRIGKN